MILLQIATDTLNVSGQTFTGHSFWFYFEIVLIVAVILIQLIHSRAVLSKIKELQYTFKNCIIIKTGYIEKVNLSKKKKTIDDIVFIDDNEDDNTIDLFSDKRIVRISIAETSGKGIIKNIKDNINNYLLNNYGATVNFSIIKDIIDREIDIKDEEISNSIPTPLYLGLAATMIGIIFGLFSMPNLNSAQFSEGISALISGVKLAMFGSLFGLAFTTALSSVFYKDAKNQVSNDKNQQISYLQGMLLPELLKSEESGVSGLKSSLDQFARDTTGLVKVLYETTLKTESNLKTQNEIIQAQKDIVQKIDNIGITKLSRANLELLNKLEKNIYSYTKFSEYVSLMGSISYQLQDFASRTSNIDNVFKHIDNSLQDNKKLIAFLSSHFDKIETSGNAALHAVDDADSHFKDAIAKLSLSTQDTIAGLYKSINESSSSFASTIEKLNDEIKTRIENINKYSVTQETHITEIYTDIGAKLKIISEEYISHLENTFKESTPKFEELSHLTELPLIKEQLINNHNLNGSKLIDIVIELKDNIQLFKEEFNKKDLLTKLTSIEEALKKRKTVHNPASDNVSLHAPTTEKLKEEKPISLIEAINVGLLKRKNNEK